MQYYELRNCLFNAVLWPIILAFSKKQADNRKLWLANYDRNNIIDIESTNLTIHDFIHKELIHFSNEDNIRSLPNMLDGLKPSQRKVLFTLLKPIKYVVYFANNIFYLREPF